MHVGDDRRRHDNKLTVVSYRSQGYTTTLINLLALSYSIVGHNFCFFGIFDIFRECNRKTVVFSLDGDVRVVYIAWVIWMISI